MADPSNVQFRQSNPPDLQGCHPPSYFGTGAAAELLPGWSVTGYYVISNQYVAKPIDLVSYGWGLADPVAAEQAHAGVFYFGHIPVSFDFCLTGGVPKQGNYGLMIRNTFQNGGVSSNAGDAASWVQVSQRGDIPIGAGTMILLSSGVYVTIDQNFVPFVPGSVTIEASLLGVAEYDISQWAGKTVTLTFSGGFGAVTADDIRFVQAKPLPPIVSGKASTNQFALSWPAQIDYYFQIEVATNLPPVWQPLAGTIITTGGVSQFVEHFSATNQAPASRYYRLRVLLRELP